MKIVIAPCHYRYLNKKTHWCIASLFRSKKHLYNHILATPTATADISRSMVATGFLKHSDYDALFYVDDDIIFKPEDADKLADYIENSGMSIVGGCYAVKGGQCNPSSRFYDKQTIQFNADAKPVEILYLAGGFMMVHRRVFEKMTSKIPLCQAGTKAEMEFYPFFMSFIKRAHWLFGGSKNVVNEYLTEDFAFCDKARELGFKIMLDPSIRLEHVGEKPFKLEDIFAPVQENMSDIKLTKVPVI